MTWTLTRREIVQTALGTGVAASLPFGPAFAKMSGAVETTTGKVRGTRTDGVSAFLGIPYGGDTSKCRFQPASAPEAWTGVRDCVAFGAQAPQGSVGGQTDRIPPNANMELVQAVMETFRAGSISDAPGSENCLFLNVYTPNASSRHKRPVLFWLHGGGFAIGSGGVPVYDGSALCRRGDVVVVTINHRLHAPGYLYLGGLHQDFADSGNVGQLDQILALQWVRDNISAFGGDPDNVTIFGQSGGGAKVSTLLAMPPAKGLFHKAIIMSGPGLTMVKKSDAEELADKTLAALGVAKADVHKLQTMDIAAIMKAASQAATGMGPGQRSLAPVVDGRSLPRDPFSPDAPEVSRDVPLVIGCTKDEATLFDITDPLFGKMTADQAKERFTRTLGKKGEAAFELYSKLRPNDPPTYWVTSMMTDMRTWINSITLAERKLAQHAAPVYMYRFDWETPLMDGVLRAPHGVDTALVFDNSDKMPRVYGSGPEPKQLGAIMSQAWINFARTGDPSAKGLAWPAYDESKRETMIFNVPSQTVSDPDAQVREFWAAA